MSVLDVLIAVFAVGMAALGSELGLVRSALPLAGFIAGAALGGRLGPEVLSGGANSAYAPLAALIGGLLGGGALAAILDAIGLDLRRRLGRGRMVTTIDGFAGAILLGLLALLLAWAFGAVVREAAAPGERGIRQAIDGSKVLGALDDALPPSGPILNVLRRVDAVPSVVGPSARVAAPENAILRSPGVRGAAGSVVKVLGSACGLGLEGSGWVGGPDLVVTNAHVVAGEDDTTVETSDGRTLDATPVHYDPRNDVAILRVPGLGKPALRLSAAPRAGTPAAILGYPGNGPFAAAAARIGRTGEVATEDSYGRGPVRRQITPFRGSVISGDSGGAVVDRRGRVETTVFAANEGGPRGGLGVPDGVVAAALAGALAPTGTGPCS